MLILLILQGFKKVDADGAGEVAVGAAAVDFCDEFINRQVLFFCFGFEGVPEFFFQRNAGLMSEDIN